MTVEPTPTLSAEDAYRLTQRIRTAASGAREAMETLSVLVEEARAGGAHAAIGRRRFRAAERCHATFGVPIDVDRPDSQISRTLAVR